MKIKQGDIMGVYIGCLYRMFIMGAMDFVCLFSLFIRMRLDRI